MQKTLLIVGFVWPEPNSSAAGSRMMQLIRFFQSNNYNVTFVSACAKADNAFDLKTLGVTQVSIELNSSSFDEFIRKLNPSIVLFDRFMTEEQYGWRVAEQCPNALRILDTEDLHCLRRARQKAFKDGKPFDIKDLFSDVAKREIASIYRCDLSLIISEVEMTILKEHFKVNDKLLLYVPFLLEPISEKDIKTLPNYNDRQHFITIGNFLHPPNYQSVLYLKQTIWPLIKQQLPKAELHIYGAYIPEKARPLYNEKEGFLIKGFVKDVNDVMQHAKVCLAPLQFGAGLKGKLIDAMQNGTPCTMTSIASEGLFGNRNENGFVEDDPETFANKAVFLHNDEQLWLEKQANGFNIINERFQSKDFYLVFVKRIETIHANLEVHRHENFIGQLLQHHMVQSTKFMSKWIEEKNK